MNDTSAPEICFCFVCHRGKLEGMAALLAASLHKNLKGPYRFVVGVPAAYGAPAPALLDFFTALGIACMAIENPIAHEYPIGNKMGCLATVSKEIPADLVVFLDTDIVCVSSDINKQDLGGADIALRIAGAPSWRLHDWPRAYACMTLVPPRETVISARTGQEMAPYYNAGVIAIRRNSPFPAMWIEVCRRLYADDQLENKFPWLDQIGIPVAIKALNLDVQVLDTRYNSIPGRVGEDCVFLHYHNDPRKILENDRGAAAVRDIIRRYPAVIQFYPLAASALAPG